MISGMFIGACLLGVYVMLLAHVPFRREEREEPDEEEDEVFVPGDRVYVRIGEDVVTRGRIVAIAGPIDGEYRIVVQSPGSRQVFTADPADVEPDDEDDDEQPAVGYRDSSKTNKDLN